MLLADVSKRAFRAHICILPLALAIHFVLREGDVLVIQVDTKLCGNLAQVLIGGPLEKVIHTVRLRPTYTRTLDDDGRTHCKSPMYNASEF